VRWFILGVLAGCGGVATTDGGGLHAAQVSDVESLQAQIDALRADGDEAAARLEALEMGGIRGRSALTIDAAACTARDGEPLSIPVILEDGPTPALVRVMVEDSPRAATRFDVPDASILTTDAGRAFDAGCSESRTTRFVVVPVSWY